MTRPDFKDFDKIARWNREVIVTEKIDGTNAQVVVSDDGTELWAASRSRYITPDDDNHGFARWVASNREALLTLGPGQHFGEWWGKGIGKRHPTVEKTFSLFNVSRWGESRPACCSVVPVLWRGLCCDFDAHAALSALLASGSVADPACKNPEGIVVFHVAGGHLFKMTLDKNDAHKWSP